MNLCKLKLVALAIAGAVMGALPATAQQPIPIGQVVTGVSLDSTPTSAVHVMDLMMRHGVLCGNASLTHQAGTTVFHPGIGPIALSAVDMGDLELVAVTRCADESAGPSVVVTVRNNSTRCLHGFHVSAVALRGPIQPWCPAAITCVESLEPGECIDVTVCLPETAWDMGRRGLEALPLTRVLVAIDSLDRFLEGNEINNVQLLDFATLPVQPVEVESTAVETTSEPVATPAFPVVPPAADTTVTPSNNNVAPSATVPSRQSVAPEVSQGPSELNALPNGFDINRLQGESTANASASALRAVLSR